MIEKAIRVSVRPSIRAWPFFLIWILAAGFLIWIWKFNPEIQHQQRNLKTGAALAIGTGLTLLWMLLFSRLRWAIRFLWLSMFLNGLLLCIILLEFKGVTGDLVPIFEFRFTESLYGSESPSEKTETVSSDTKKALGARQLPFAYPQFQGVSRDSRIEGFKLNRDWDQNPPELLWRRSIGAAWSGFVAQDRYAITQEQGESMELVTCYDPFTGELLWSHSDTGRYDSPIGGLGPRATPLISGSRVYTMGATGILNCLEIETGNPVWSRNVIKENEASILDWGVSHSPLIVGENIIVTPGGSSGRSVVAYQKDTGELVWSGGERGSSYSSPFLPTVYGNQQIVVFNKDGITGHSIHDGTVVWDYPWSGRNPNVAIPLALPGNKFLASSGYGVGCALLNIHIGEDQKLTVEREWKSLRLKSKFSNVIEKEGYIYGLDDGIMVCLDLADGKRKWKEGRYGHGQFILVGDLLLISTEKSEIVLFEPVPDEPRELHRIQVLEGKTWNPPCLAGPYLLVRNHKEAACYRIPIIEE
jgi:outer membrane protein assembly factor BamB